MWYTNAYLMGRVHCPACGSSRVFRDRRRGLAEFLRFTPFRPYACRECQRRFYGFSRRRNILSRLRAGLDRWAWSMSAACPYCHARELRRTSGRHIHSGRLRRVFRFLRVPAYRCLRCGNRFFKLRFVSGKRVTETASR